MICLVDSKYSLRIYLEVFAFLSMLIAVFIEIAFVIIHFIYFIISLFKKVYDYCFYLPPLPQKGHKSKINKNIKAKNEIKNDKLLINTKPLNANNSNIEKNPPKVKVPLQNNYMKGNGNKCFDPIQNNFIEDNKCEKEYCNNNSKIKYPVNPITNYLAYKAKQPSLENTSILNPVQRNVSSFESHSKNTKSISILGIKLQYKDGHNKIENKEPKSFPPVFNASNIPISSQENSNSFINENIKTPKQ